jgi:hypothetical protein
MAEEQNNEGGWASNTVSMETVMAYIKKTTVAILQYFYGESC